MDENGSRRITHLLLYYYTTLERDLRCSVEDHDRRLAIRTIVEVDIDVVTGVCRVDYVLAMESINRLPKGCAGILGAATVLVVVEVLWRFLDGLHRAPAFRMPCVAEGHNPLTLFHTSPDFYDITLR